MKRKKRKKMYQTTLEKIVKTTQEADENILKLIEETKGTQVSQIKQAKPDDVVRVFFENFNSLGVFTQGKARRKKIKRLRELAGKYDIDVMCGVETQTDWRYAKTSENFDNLLFRGEERKSVVGFNSAEDKMCRHQEGGTAMVARGRLSGMVLESG